MKLAGIDYSGLFRHVTAIMTFVPNEFCVSIRVSHELCINSDGMMYIMYL